MDSTKHLTVDRSYLSEGGAPLYARYRNQTEPQPAYLELDEDGTVRVGINAEIGNAVPFDVWHGRRLQWRIPADLTPMAIDELIETALPLLARVYEGHSVRWDGNNTVGVLSADALAASYEIGKLCTDLCNQTGLYDPSDRVQVWRIDDWLGANNVRHPSGKPDVYEIDGVEGEITATTTDETLQTLAELIEANARQEEVFIDDDVLEYLQGLRDELNREAESET